MTLQVLQDHSFAFAQDAKSTRTKAIGLTISVLHKGHGYKSAFHFDHGKNAIDVIVGKMYDDKQLRSLV